MSLVEEARLLQTLCTRPITEINGRPVNEMTDDEVREAVKTILAERKLPEYAVEDWTDRFG